ncbi:zinc finger protein ZFP1 [Trypanosoma rangeli]|uniref:Zinc finger protein ZFP1 n=1 Tax=Trypanosoma rangeli TaxID=5698 RepID=A0A422NWB0_TRYRA|nr:zinc finger protein ZFP1 [Trypanosoma rangeli]RNF09714.1 zinc finger protein ZFP1 [Trypanosoma rangeli]|eukprot:RNF09714.1 zinc finger protein ZFP1 [Trypanosoma rangeli]
MWTPKSPKPQSESSTFYSRLRDTRQIKLQTRVCRNFAVGHSCLFGERCAFLHFFPERSIVRRKDSDMPPPPPYSEVAKGATALPPAYPSRFRHDPYRPEGFVVVAEEFFTDDGTQHIQSLGGHHL